LSQSKCTAGSGSNMSHPGKPRISDLQPRSQELYQGYRKWKQNEEHILRGLRRLALNQNSQTDTQSYPKSSIEHGAYYLTQNRDYEANCGRYEIEDDEILLQSPNVDVNEISMEWFTQVQSSETQLERFIIEQDFGVIARLQGD